MKRLGATILSLLMLFSGLAMASMPQPETEETGQLAIDVAIVGYAGTTVTEDESLTMDCSSENLLDNPPLTVLGEKVANEGYTENLNAVNGAIIYTKSLDLDTANANAIQNNLEVHKTIDYVASEGGKLVFDEDALMNDMGSGNLGQDVLCPFWHGNYHIIAYNEMVTAGTYMEMQSVSATTNTEIRTIAESADTPVAMSYNVHAGATTLDDLPGALGYIEATVSVHSMDSRTWLIPRNIGPTTPPLGNEVIYTQKTTASGIFDFRKSMTYLSGVTLTGPAAEEDQGLPPQP